MVTVRGQLAPTSHVTSLGLRPQGLGKGLDSFPGTPATSFYDPQSPHSARNTPMSSVQLMDASSPLDDLGVGVGSAVSQAVQHLNHA